MPAGRRVAKGLGVALLVGGIVYGTGAAAARGRARPAAALTWLSDEGQALALAKAEGRPVILDFWAEWCTACKELDHTAWADPRVQAEASRFVAVKVDGTTGSDAFQAASAKYRVVGMPSVVFIDAHGREVPERVDAAVGGDEMIRRLRAVDAACDAPARTATAAGALACAARW